MGGGGSLFLGGLIFWGAYYRNFIYYGISISKVGAKAIISSSLCASQFKGFLPEFLQTWKHL